MIKFISFQICALLIMALLFYLTNNHKRIRIGSTVAYNQSLIMCSMSLIVDVLSVFAIVYTDQFGENLTNIICKTYIVLLTYTAYSAFNYLMVNTWLYKKHQLSRWIPRCALAIITAMVYVLPIYKYYDGEKLYTYGPATIVVYATTFTCMISTMLLTFSQKRNLNTNRQRSVRIWMYIWFTAAIIQLFCPQILLVGFASALGLFVLYGELETPISYIDTETNLFNLKAVKIYAQEQLNDTGSVYGVCIKFDTISKQLSSGETKELVIKLSKSFAAINDLSFRIDTYSFILLTKKNKIDTLVNNLNLQINMLKNENPELFEDIRISYAIVKDDRVFDKLDDIIHSYYHFRNDKDHEEIIITKNTLEPIRKFERIKTKILNAIESDRVEVFFQPIYDINSGKFTSAEALVRIRDKDDSIISPGEFIPVAEKTGLIIPLGQIIFEQVCSYLHNLNENETDLKYVEVNLSAGQFKQEDLFDKFYSIMIKYGVRPEQLNFEITETKQLTISNKIFETMNKFIGIGCTFSLDDFGTGNSNIDYIASMPVKIIKFDKTLTDKYFTEDKTKLILKHLVPMIKDLNYKIVCEGVETEEQFKEIVDLGMDYIQGYYFSKPLPKDEYHNFCIENKKE